MDRTVYQMDDYVHQVLGFDVREKEPVRVEKMVSFYSSPRHRHKRAADQRREVVFRFGTFEEALDRHTRAWGRAVGRLRRSQVPKRRPRPTSVAGTYLAHLAGLLPAHRRPGYRGSGPRPERRGLSGAHLLGRVVHLPVPELPAAGDHARVPHVPLLPAPGRSPRRGPRGWIQRSHVPLAERVRRARGDASRSPQPKLRQVGPGSFAQPAARKRRHLLQHLALLPRHRRLRVPPRSRRGDDAGDRPLLGFSIAHYNEERDRYEIHGVMGPRRVPRKVSRLRRRRTAEQRLYQRNGRLDLRDRPGGA